jgi:hypothetical protein
MVLLFRCTAVGLSSPSFGLQGSRNGGRGHLEAETAVQETIISYRYNVGSLCLTLHIFGFTGHVERLLYFAATTRTHCQGYIATIYQRCIAYTAVFMITYIPAGIG